ncbi:MAG: LytR/AlgR family response regulator transcription factor [Butyrivibrio sp.]
MIHIAICDDDERILENLKIEILNILDNQAIVSLHDNPFSLITYIMDEAKGTVDAVFMDICLKSQNGIYVAESILEECPNIKMIFMTSYIDRVRDIFRINPVYFLIKPFEENYLKDALYKVIKMIDEEDADIIRIGTGHKGVTTLKTRNIYYIESDKRQIIFHLQDTERACYMKLDILENQLKSNFLRVHQSYIVNMDKIKEVNKNNILLYNDTVIPISRSKYKEVTELINKYMNIG